MYEMFFMRSEKFLCRRHTESHFQSVRAQKLYKTRISVIHIEISLLCKFILHYKKPEWYCNFVDKAQDLYSIRWKFQFKLKNYFLYGYINNLRHVWNFHDSTILYHWCLTVTLRGITNSKTKVVNIPAYVWIVERRMNFKGLEILRVK